MQVVALRLRSQAKLSEPELALQDDFDYAAVLNAALPADIRVHGWADVSPTFSARFDALKREYKYFFVQRGGLDVAAMQSAARLFIGEHDFQNFCRVDPRTVTHFWRKILDFQVELVRRGGGRRGRSVCPPRDRHGLPVAPGQPRAACGTSCSTCTVFCIVHGTLKPAGYAR